MRESEIAAQEAQGTNGLGHRELDRRGGMSGKKPETGQWRIRRLRRWSNVDHARHVALAAEARGREVTTANLSADTAEYTCWCDPRAVLIQARHAAAVYL